MDITCLTNYLKPDTITKTELATLTLEANATEIKVIDKNNLHLKEQGAGWILLTDCKTNDTELIQVNNRQHSGDVTTFTIIGRAYDPNTCDTATNTNTGTLFNASADVYVGEVNRKYFCQLIDCLKNILQNASGLSCTSVIGCFDAGISINMSTAKYVYGKTCNDEIAKVSPYNVLYVSTAPDQTFTYTDANATVGSGRSWKTKITMSPITIGTHCNNLKLRATVQGDFRPVDSPQPTRDLNLYTSLRMYVNGSQGTVPFKQGATTIISSSNAFISNTDSAPTFNFTGYWDLSTGTNVVEVEFGIGDASILNHGSHAFVLNSIVVIGEIIQTG